MTEAVSTADALQKTCDAEATKRSTLETVVASACEGLSVEADPSGSSLRGCVEALYSRVSERLRDALHTGVKKALPVVSSHYIDIDLPVVSKGYVVPDDEEEAREEV